MKNKVSHDIQTSLFSLQDPKYKSFQEKLMPTVEPDTVIGIRTPVLRRFASDFAKTEEASVFMESLPHRYYEENNLHAFLIEKLGDFEKTVEALDAFLPYIDNWATCDMMSPKIFAKNKDKLLPHIEKWLDSAHIYTVRFGIVTLMKYHLDADFSPLYLEKIAKISSDAYYINMAAAWFFAEALIKQYEYTLPYLTERKLSPWVHNKTISKACDSFRISKETKNYLKTLRISEKRD
ncbi:MAG: DNA alkylation repair protein [Clostridia bacterium]|nr:DNA alkylation repair protein [Clostridia bacterium]